jgi:tetratricopeptide (TPR) repeat protein
VILFASPAPAWADGGVPMLVIMGVPMWLALLVIIPLEAVMARQIISLSWKASFKVSTLANLFSTLLGVPLTWGVLVLAEWGIFRLLDYNHSGATSYLQQPGSEPITLLISSPWLLPMWSDIYWMIPAAGLILCIPFFFVSVWSENIVARKLVKSELRHKALSWAWKANAASYTLMAIFIAGFWVTSVFEHNRIANDEEHRDVDLVSADRLWEIRLPRVKEFRKEENSVAAKPLKSSSEPIELALSQSRFADAQPLLEDYTKGEDERLDNAKPNEYLYPQYDLRLGIVYQKLGEKGKAEHFYQHVIERSRKLGAGRGGDSIVRAVLAYADMQVAQNHPSRAYELYSEALTVPSSASGELAYCKMARYYCSAKKYTDGEQLLMEAIQEEERYCNMREFPPHSVTPQLSLALAQCYLEDGKLPLAARWIKEALLSNDLLSRAAETYARLMEKQGKSNLAKIWHERAQESAPLESADLKYKQ